MPIPERNRPHTENGLKKTGKEGLPGSEVRDCSCEKKNNSAGGLLKARLQRKVYRARDIGIGRDFEWSNTEKDRGAEQQVFSQNSHHLCVNCNYQPRGICCWCCVTKLIPGKQHTHTSTYRREGTRTGTTSVPLGEAMSFIGVTYRSMGEYKMPSSKSTPAMMIDSQQNWEPRAQGTTCRELNKLEFPFQVPQWSQLIKGSTASFLFLLAAALPSESLRIFAAQLSSAERGS